MKKSILLTLAALAIIFTQCKKAESVVPQGGTTQGGETIEISLKINKNSKVIVDPGSTVASVTFQTGDVIHVASDGKYSGTLTCDGGIFKGTIVKPSKGSTMYFYFLGNKSATDTDGNALSTTTGSESTTIMVNISDQSSALPVISYGTATYNETTTEYSATLRNQCGLVKFTSDYTGSGTLSIKKMNNKVTVDLVGNTFTPGKVTDDGVITLNKASDGVYWAILLPQASIKGSTPDDAYSSDGWTGIYGAVPAITANSYVATGVAIVTVPGLYFTSLQDGSNVSFNVTNRDFEWSTDGFTWGSDDDMDTKTLNTGDILYIRATTEGNKLACGVNYFFFPRVESLFSTSGNLKVSGNIMYLLKQDGSQVDLTDENYQAGENVFGGIPEAGCFQSLFQDCIAITDASELILPATTLAKKCYCGMFLGCTGLTSVPVLPAITLAENCYEDMFSYCENLTSAPALPATTLAANCYSNMFAYCGNLTSAPALPATTLAESCYYNMFSQCTTLTTVPETLLHATNLAANCYSNMFAYCENLTSAPALSATTLAESCYSYMFCCTSLTSAPALPATTLAANCYEGMFLGCTGLTSVPALPATTLAECCYYNMFSQCTTLTTVPETLLHATNLAKSCYHQMFWCCTSLTSAPALPAATLAESCYRYMFTGCTSLTSVPVLPATTLAESCYYNMFNNCSKLSSVTMLATDVSANYALEDWLENAGSDASVTSAKLYVDKTMTGNATISGTLPSAKWSMAAGN